jgi:hypothetical protein
MPINPTEGLGSQPGNIALARCLVLPDQDSETTPAARGTIFVCGVDGVCRQLANQALFSTGSPGHAPLTVKNAGGYFASSFLYQTYGTQSGAWASKIVACAGVLYPAIAYMKRGAMIAISLPHHFEAQAREALGGDTQLLSRLLSLKGEVQQFTAKQIPGFGPPDAAKLNARNQYLLDSAAILLGP